MPKPDYDMQDEGDLYFIDLSRTDKIKAAIALTLGGWIVLGGVAAIAWIMYRAS